VFAALFLFGSMEVYASRMRWGLADVERIRDQWVRVIQSNLTQPPEDKAERLKPRPFAECEGRREEALRAGIFDEEDVELWRHVGLAPILIERGDLTFFGGIRSLCEPNQ
jgi:hypothetical protein